MNTKSINPFLKTITEIDEVLDSKHFNNFLERTNDVLDLCIDENQKVEFNPLVEILKIRRNNIISPHNSEEVKIKKEKVKYLTMKMLKNILDKGFDPYYVLEKEIGFLTSYNALHVAAEFRDSKAINLLLKYSVKGINNKTNTEKTATGILISFVGTIGFLNIPPPALNSLFKSGADINDPFFLKRLYFLFDRSDGQKNNREWIKVLKENNFKMDKPLYSGLSLLHLFTKHKQLDALKILWKDGYDSIGIPENCSVSIESVIHPKFKDIFIKEYINYQKQILNRAMPEIEINNNQVIHKKNRL